MDDTERATRGCKAFNERVLAGGSFTAMSWKSEDGTLGPAYVYADGAENNRVLRGFDDPDPEGVFYLGWQRRGKMVKLAKDLGVKMQEW